MVGDGSLITALAAQRRGPLVAAGSAAGRVCLLRPGAAAPHGQVELREEVTSLAWHPDGRHLCAGTGRGELVGLAIA